MEKEIELIPFLEGVMKRTTKHYQEDLNIDFQRLKEAAKDPGDEHVFYWMARPCGTWIVTERDAFLEGSSGHTVWTYYDNMAKGIQAYRVVVTGIRDDMPLGTVRKLNYPEQVKRVKAHALPAVKVEITFMSGQRREVPVEKYPHERKRLFTEYGISRYVRYCPENEAELDRVLAAELDRVLAAEHCCPKKPRAKSAKKPPQHGAR